MPKVIEKTVYKFSELSEQAKQRVLENECDINVDYAWWDFIYDDAAEIGIKIEGFDLGRSRDIKGLLTMSAYDSSKLVIDSHGDQCATYKVAKKYIEQATVIMVTEKLLGNEDSPSLSADCDIADLDEQYEKDILSCYWKMLDDEYDWRKTDEQIIETINCNEYEFDEDGDFI